MHQHTTEAALQYRVRDDFTIVDPHPPEDAAEYQITTNTKFSLSLNQQNGNPDEPLVMTGTGTIYAEESPEVALGTARVRIEIARVDHQLFEGPNVGVSSEKSVNRHYQSKGMPNRKSLPTGVIPILLPGQVKPVKKIQSIRQDCHQQDPGRREVIGQKPDSHSHYRSRFSRLPTGYGCSKGRAAVPAELLGRFRFSTAIGTEWHTE